MLKDDDVMINIMSERPDKRVNKAQLKKEKFAERFQKRNDRSKTPKKNESSLKDMYNGTDKAPETEKVNEEQQRPQSKSQPKQQRPRRYYE